MKKIFPSFILLLCAFYFYSCTCRTCGAEEIKLPATVKVSADEFIISYTGKNFFDSYIKFDPIRSQSLGNEFLLVYEFKMKEKSFVDELITFSIDSTGNIISTKDIVGIPSVLENPNSVNFEIDEAAAREIAKENKLEPGIKEWKVGFMWNAKWQRYVWHILNTLSEGEGSHGYRGSGKEMIIAPSNGEVLEYNEWNVF
ncbi:MAG: hypothetical protein C0425_10960 [Chlorobiaceae bacterium]|mgnify:CR=1 FL=1|nr:hypothetical protein [Chlorobiaceae bacterium]MBA4310837.1 hypothetical protein [Chlorobiaceae bacterium]